MEPEKSPSVAYEAFDAGSHLSGVVGILAPIGWDNFRHDPWKKLQFTPALIDDDGNVADQKTREFLQKFLAAFEKFLDRQLA